MNALSYESTPGAARLNGVAQGHGTAVPAAPTPKDPRMTRRDVGLLVEITQAAKLLGVGALTFGLTLTVCWPLRHQESIFAALSYL